MQPGPGMMPQLPQGPQRGQAGFPGMRAPFAPMEAGLRGALAQGLGGRGGMQSQLDPGLARRMLMMQMLQQLMGQGQGLDPAMQQGAFLQGSANPFLAGRAY